ncbi:NADH-quinone oxidoreductase subunit J family protein [Parapedobacter lycopersici]|uniref:NADH-quinone oxidoreductase subunit J family protein n=1 Tax=Parapedobacter lycopersici TaxID=1864939 RepID=UPI00214D7FFB|nr:NADH-quinone oxidoreductase subunit J [Parapedobacter lycopersici]
MMESILFYCFATVAVGTSFILVSMRNIARALFLFFVVLFAMAGLYVFALADFVALTQILIYVGGVLVLLLFAFMLSNKELLNQLQAGTSHFFALPVWQALTVALLFLGVLLYAALQFDRHEPQWIAAAREAGTVITPTDRTVQHLGIHLMTRYLLPFEVISVLLMMALMGAAHLARKGGQT